MKNTTVTTGEAAKLCSVKRDTMLKWLKSNKIPSLKTAGGHFRIQLDDLRPFITQKDLPITKNEYPSQTSDALYRIWGSVIPCWEYNSPDGSVMDGCKECIVMQAGIMKCYFIANKKKVTELGHSALFCKNTCEKCSYYTYATDTKKRILILSEIIKEKSFIEGDLGSHFHIKITHSPYEASTIIQHFRPDLIVIDKSLAKCNPEEVYTQIKNDHRVRNSHIILGISLPSDRHKKSASLDTIDMRKLIKDLEQLITLPDSDCSSENRNALGACGN